MSIATLQFFGALTYFLPPARQDGPVACEFEGNPAVKHLIEALGIPHPEVARIETGGSRVEMGYRVQAGDELLVYPPEPEPDHPTIPLPARFVLDIHLGKLAHYLRMLGFDTFYRNDYEDPEIARIAAQEGRVLLTRDRRLLMRKEIVYGYCVRASDPRQQIVEVLRRFGLARQAGPFRRCLRCNSPLVPVEKAAILERLEPLTRKYFDDFHLCPNCQQVYWKGSHYERMRRTIAATFSQLE